MAVRNSMLGLVDLVRSMIHDTNGDQFDTERVQIALDRYRLSHVFETLRGEETISGGVVSCLTFSAATPWWGSDAAVYNSSFSMLSAVSADYLRGVWEFSVSPARPVYVSGTTYDVFAAAADLLDEWAVACALEFDFKTEGGASFSRSQKAKALREAAAGYRVRSNVVVKSVLRGDEPFVIDGGL